MVPENEAQCMKDGTQLSGTKHKYTEKSLRFPIAVIYILIIFLLAMNRLFQLGIVFRYAPVDWVLFGGGYLGLVVMELLESQIYPRRVHFFIAVLFLGLRAVLIAAIFRADIPMTSLPILAVLIYAIYFYSGLFLALCLFIASLVLMAPYAGEFGFNLIEETAYLGFMILFASQICRDDRIRRRNLDLYRELENYAENSTALVKQDERNRISRDLHDNLGHYLVGVNLQLQKAMAYREIDAAESDKAVQLAQEATAEAIKELRQTLTNLREIDDQINFREDIQKLVDGVKANGLPVDVAFQGIEGGFSELVLVTLRQAVQEGLTNIEKHAQAKQVKLSIEFNRKQAELRLVDDGVGFSPAKVDESTSFGLSGLRQRVELVGGTLKIDSKSNKGTTLKVTIPRKFFA
jgi:signal transduction histidine kinase